MVLMVAIAFIFDAAQWLVALIPYVGFFFMSCISVVAWGVFFLWLGHYGARMTAERAIVTGLAEIMPILNAAPVWTISTFLTIRSHNKALGEV